MKKNYRVVKTKKASHKWDAFAVWTVSCNTETKEKTSNNDDPKSGFMFGNDSKSDAMLQFTKAYEDNNIATVKSIFTEDAVFNVNDTKLTFEEVKAGFSAGHDLFIKSV